MIGLTGVVGMIRQGLPRLVDGGARSVRPAGLSTAGIEPRLARDKRMTISFVGPGEGSALLMVRVAQILLKPLTDLSRRYEVSFKLNSVGATERPSGVSAASLADITLKMLDHEASKNHAGIAVLSNTASSIFPSIRNVIPPGLRVVSLVGPTSHALYSRANIVMHNGQCRKDVAILGTPTTIESHEYPKVLAKLHAQECGEDAVAVVINDDKRFPGPRAYRGARGLIRGSAEESEVLAQVKQNKSLKPVLFIHMYSPKNWGELVHNRESTTVSPEDQRRVVRSNLEEMVAKSGKEQFGLVSVMALVCSEYPLLRHIIRESLRDMGFPATQVMGQANSTATLGIRPILDGMVNEGLFGERDQLRPADKVRVPLVSTVLASSQPEGEAFLSRVRRLAKEYNQDLVFHEKVILTK